VAFCPPGAPSSAARSSAALPLAAPSPLSRAPLALSLGMQHRIGTVSPVRLSGLDSWTNANGWPGEGQMRGRIG
jgi:hypothetical protein